MPPATEKSFVREATIEALSLASLAPSAHNTQPWQCELLDGEVRISRSPARTLNAGDPTTRQACLAIGMFTETFAIAARYLGLKVEVEARYATPRDTELARVSVTDARGQTGRDEENDRLFSAIRQRHTNRGLYRSETSLPWLRAWTASQPGVRIFAIQDAERKRLLGTVAGAAIRLALSLPALRNELAELIRFDGQTAPIGMPIGALLGRQESSDEPLSVGALDPEQQERMFTTRYSDAPALIVLATETDEPPAWVRAGRDGMRLLLRAASEELTHCISAGPVEIPTLSPIVRQATDPALRPQLFFRVGEPLEDEYSSYRTDRLDLEAVLGPNEDVREPQGRSGRLK